MKKIILMALIMTLAMTLAVSAATQDYIIISSINISQHLANPQAFENIPGGFIIIDWQGSSSVAYLMDGQANLLNFSNSATQAKYNLTANFSAKITSIRSFNTTGNITAFVLSDDTAKRLTLANASDMSRYNQLWFAPSPGNFSSADSITGICTNGSIIRVAVANRKVIDTFYGANSSVNQSEFIVPVAANVSSIGCKPGGNSTAMMILDDSQGLIYTTKNETFVTETINISNLTGTGLNTFSDIAMVSSEEFYALNNFTKVAYLFRKRASSVLNIYAPNISFSGDTMYVKSRFSNQLVQINFSTAQGNSSGSIFSQADQINCSLFMNRTILNATIFATNNISINNSFNVSFAPGTYQVQINCKANSTHAAASYSLARIIQVETFRHLFWISDNFSAYYNSESSQIEISFGNSTSILGAPINITTGEPIVLGISWNNATGNRTIYINGEYRNSDLKYGWSKNRMDKIFLGSRNDSGQLNGTIAYIQTENSAKTPNFKKGDFFTAWKSATKSLDGAFTPSYFYQLRARLIRSLTSERPVLRYANIYMDDTMMNTSMPSGVKFLDFKFSSGTSSSIPAGQQDALPIFVLSNKGNVSFSVRVFSYTQFSDCFKALLFNKSAEYLQTVNSTNLSTIPQTIANLTPGASANVWINATATGCTSGSEIFDLVFETSP